MEPEEKSVRIMELRIIGKVSSVLKKIEDCPLQESEQAPEATIVIDKAFVAGIRSIEPGNEIVLLTWLDKADRTVIECFPRKQVDAPRIGVFSTRSPDRPNPIGIHRTKVISIEENSIRVSSLEVLDGTPVIDIKPVWGSL